MFLQHNFCIIIKLKKKDVFAFYCLKKSRTFSLYSTFCRQYSEPTNKTFISCQCFKKCIYNICYILYLALCFDLLGCVVMLESLVPSSVSILFFSKVNFRWNLRHKSSNFISILLFYLPDASHINCSLSEQVTSSHNPRSQAQCWFPFALFGSPLLQFE